MICSSTDAQSSFAAILTAEWCDTLTPAQNNKHQRRFVKSGCLGKPGLRRPTPVTRSPTMQMPRTKKTLAYREQDVKKERRCKRLRDGILDDDGGGDEMCYRGLPTRAEVATSFFGQNPLEGGSARHGLQVRRSATKPCSSRYGVGASLTPPLPLRMSISYTQDLSPAFVMLSPYLPFPICIRILSRRDVSQSPPFF